MPIYEERYPAEYWFSCYSHFEVVTEQFLIPLTEGKKLVYYDVETQKRAEEVGGWDHADQMLISIAITYSDDDQYRVWREKDIPDMIRYMSDFDWIVSFNGDNFDSRVLSHYDDVAAIHKKSFDVAQYLSRRLKHRIKLDSVATATLNVGKTADGLLALQWWKEGKVEDIIEYCKQDVKVLKDIVEFGQIHRYVQYFDWQNNPIKISVDW